MRNRMKSLEKLKKEIFFGEHSDEEWKRIKLQVDKKDRNLLNVEPVHYWNRFWNI